MNSKIFIMSNIGSSSNKYSVYIKNKSKTELILTLNNNNKGRKKENSIFSIIISKLKKQNIDLRKSNLIFGVRVVAPGIFFQEHQVINQKYLSRLKEIKHLALLHIKPVLKEITIIKKHFPKAKIIACSDSSFHKSVPNYAKTYAIPNRLTKKNQIYRFGYHGLAVQSAISKLKKEKKLAKKTIICHLGSGSSVTAVKNGKSIDNSMGFSPLEGIMGSTRSGSVDPTLKISSKILNQESGFLGLTGNNDLRIILEKIKKQKKSNNNSKEKQALQIYIHQVQKAIGSAIAILNGVDLLVFTGGVGAGSALIRKLVLKKLTFSKTKINIVKVDEMQEMFQICWKLTRNKELS